MWNGPGYPALKERRSLFPEILILAILCLSLFISASVTAQEFPCDGSFYFVATNSDTGSKFYRMFKKGLNNSFDYEELPFDNPGKRHITCLGYNTRDQKIYGLDFNTYELLRIERNGKIQSLGVPVNLDTTYKYYAGEMTPDGRGLMVIARNPKTGIDDRVYMVRVNSPPDHYAGYFSIISDVPVAMSDLTIDPVVGVTYGFDLLNGQIVVTDLTGLTSTSLVRKFEKISQGFGSLFFDRNGQMYGLGSPGRDGGEQSVLYEIEKGSGKSSRLASIVGGRDTDGCACPYTIEFQKRINPVKIVGCDQVTIEYSVINRAGIGQLGINLLDHLPPDFNIVDIIMDNIFLVNIHSGIGSNTIDLDAWTLLLGKNKIELVVNVLNPEPQVVASQALLNNLSPSLKQFAKSDDPATPQIADATKLTVTDFEDIKLNDFIRSSCDGDTTFLTLPMEGQFLWSDGSSEPVLPVLKNGLYSVTLLADCFVYSDSLQVIMRPEILELELGPDLQLDLGDHATLGFTTNAKKISSMEWKTSDDLILSCYDCAQPEFTGIANTSVSLTIKDDRGCSVTDAINISVDEAKRIFVPTAFSPNDDGVNDVLHIYGKSVKISEFNVFDRWGSLVFQRSDLALDETIGWDGTYQGMKLSPGVYIWSAQLLFPDQKSKGFSGTVAIIY